MATILVIDDDSPTGILHDALVREGLDVRTARTGRDALRVVRAAKPDLIIVDIDIRDESDFRLLPALRICSRVPLVVLNTCAHEHEILTAYSEGADDYVVKPINAQVLLSRIKAILRRTRSSVSGQWPGGSQAYSVHGVVFDPERNEISSGGVRVRLTRMESGILRELVIHEGQVLVAERLI
ncbi:MAG TPA: response regulator transcription factor [Chloroflexota bacterium]|nr:response regulator transcription factor [Chloroflexota bacterium]